MILDLFSCIYIQFLGLQGGSDPLLKIFCFVCLFGELKLHNCSSFSVQIYKAQKSLPPQPEVHEIEFDFRPGIPISYSLVLKALL